MGGVVAQSLPAALRREDTRREAEEAFPPAARQTPPPHPPPKLKPRAKTWDGVRDGGPGAQEGVSVQGFYLGGFAYTDRLCPAAWAYDLQVQTCRFFTGVDL